MGQGGPRDGFIVKELPCEREKLSSVYRIHIKSLCGGVLAIPVLRRQRQADPWGSLRSSFPKEELPQIISGVHTHRHTHEPSHIRAHARAHRHTHTSSHTLPSHTSTHTHTHSLPHTHSLYEYVTVGTRQSLSLSSLAPESALWAQISAESLVWWVEVVCILSSN